MQKEKKAEDVPFACSLTTVINYRCIRNLFTVSASSSLSSKTLLSFRRYFCSAKLLASRNQKQLSSMKECQTFTLFSALLVPPPTSKLSMFSIIISIHFKPFHCVYKTFWKFFFLFPRIFLRLLNFAISFPIHWQKAFHCSLIFSIENLQEKLSNQLFENRTREKENCLTFSARCWRLKIPQHLTPYSISCRNTEDEWNN